MKSCNNSDNINGFSFVLQSTLISFVLANNLKPAEQAMLGIFLENIGSNLVSISSYNSYIEEKCESNGDEAEEENIPIKPIITPPLTNRI